MSVIENLADKVTEAILDRDQCRVEKERAFREVKVLSQERDQARKELESAGKERDQALQELEVSKSEALLRGTMLEQAELEAQKLKTDNTELQLQAIAQESEINGLKISLDKATQDLAAVGPQAVERFLKSDSFKCAVLASVVNTLRFAMYHELFELGRSYPFTPEEIGFEQVTEGDAEPKDLVAYHWDEEKDVLLDPSENKVPARLTLQTCESNRRPAQRWHLEDWPEDIDFPDPSSDEEEAIPTEEVIPEAEAIPEVEIIPGPENVP